MFCADGLAYLHDTSRTLAAFLSSYPPAAFALAACNSPGLLTQLISLHDQLLPLVAAAVVKPSGASGSSSRGSRGTLHPTVALQAGFAPHFPWPLFQYWEKAQCKAIPWAGMHGPIAALALLEACLQSSEFLASNLMSSRGPVASVTVIGLLSGRCVPGQVRHHHRGLEDNLPTLASLLILHGLLGKHSLNLPSEALQAQAHLPHTPEQQGQHLMVALATAELPQQPGSSESSLLQRTARQYHLAGAISDALAQVSCPVRACLTYHDFSCRICTVMHTGVSAAWSLVCYCRHGQA